MEKRNFFRGPLSHASDSKDTDKRYTRETLCANGQHYVNITLWIYSIFNWVEMDYSNL